MKSDQIFLNDFIVKFINIKLSANMQEQTTPEVKRQLSGSKPKKLIPRPRFNNPSLYTYYLFKGFDIGQIAIWRQAYHWFVEESQV